MRLVLASILSWLVMAALAMALFGWLLADAFDPLRALFRPLEEQAETAGYAQSAQFLRVFFFVAIIRLWHGPRAISVGQGALYGLLMGLFAGTFHVANSASLPLPASTAVAWVAFDIVLLVAGGIVFALSYRPQTKAVTQ